MKIVARREVKLNQNYGGNEYNNDSRGNGYSYEYKLDNGTVVTNEQAYEMALRGELDGILASHNGSTKYIRSIGDGKDGNDLDDLPKF